MSAFDWQLFDAQPKPIKSLVWDFGPAQLEGLGVIHIGMAGNSQRGNKCEMNSRNESR